MIEDLRAALKEKEMVFGTEKTLKNLKMGKSAIVFIASNCPSGIRKQVEHYAGISGAKVTKLDVPDKEIGLICKKPFGISVLSY